MVSGNSVNKHFTNEFKLFSFLLFVKLDFEIAVVQQTRAHDRTFVPAGQPRPYLVNFWPIFAKSP